MLPDQWPLVALEPTKEQFKTVKSSFKVAMSNTYFAPRMRDVLLVMPTGGEQVALFSAHGRAGRPGIPCGGDECLDGVLHHSG